MALVIDSSAVTLFTETPDSFNKIIDVNFYPAGGFLQSFFNIVGGYIAPTEEVYSSKLGYTGQASSGDCTIKSDDGTIIFQKRTINPKTVKSEMFFCLESIPKNLLARMGEIKSAYDLFGFSENENIPDSLKWIMSKVLMSLSESVLRYAFYGKVTANVANSTTPGLKSAANVKYYSLISGVVDQLNTAIGADNVKHLDPSSYTSISDLIDDVIDNSDPQLRAIDQKELWLDRYSFSKLEKDLIKLDRVSAFTVMNGIPTLTYRGFPVYSLEGVEHLFNGDFVNNTTDNAAWQPTKVILKPKDSFMIATINESDFADVKVRYEPRYIKVNEDGSSEQAQAGFVVNYAYAIDSFVGAYPYISVALGSKSWA